jgi:hypothetical protein
MKKTSYRSNVFKILIEARKNNNKKLSTKDIVSIYKKVYEQDIKPNTANRYKREFYTVMNHIDFVMPHNNNQGDNDYSFVIA